MIWFEKDDNAYLGQENRVVWEKFRPYTYIVFFETDLIMIFIPINLYIKYLSNPR